MKSRLMNNTNRMKQEALFKKIKTTTAWLFDGEEFKEVKKKAVLFLAVIRPELSQHMSSHVSLSGIFLRCCLLSLAENPGKARVKAKRENERKTVTKQFTMRMSAPPSPPTCT